MTDYRCDTTRVAISRADAVRQNAGHAGQIKQLRGGLAPRIVGDDFFDSPGSRRRGSTAALQLPPPGQVTTFEATLHDEIQRV